MDELTYIYLERLIDTIGLMKPDLNKNLRQFIKYEKDKVLSNLEERGLVMRTKTPKRDKANRLRMLNIFSTTDRGIHVLEEWRKKYERILVELAHDSCS